MDGRLSRIDCICFINVSFCRQSEKFLLVSLSINMFLVEPDSSIMTQSRHAAATHDSLCCFHACRRILNNTRAFIWPLNRAADHDPSTVTFEGDIPKGA